MHGTATPSRRRMSKTSTRGPSRITPAVAQRGQLICLFSQADAHIAICDPKRLPGPEAVIRLVDCAHVIVKALREGDHHPLLLQARLKDHAKAARPRAPCRPRASAGSPENGVLLAQGLRRPALEGQAAPPNWRDALAGVATGRHAARHRPRPRTLGRGEGP